jgi:hypothetical protein
VRYGADPEPGEGHRGDVETERTVEERMLAQAERQTAALESLRGIVIALIWSGLALVALLVWVFFAFGR